MLRLDMNSATKLTSSSGIRYSELTLIKKNYLICRHWLRY